MNVALKPLASQVILEMLGVFCNQFILCIVVQPAILYFFYLIVVLGFFLFWTCFKASFNCGDRVNGFLANRGLPSRILTKEYPYNITTPKNSFKIIANDKSSSHAQEKEHHKEKTVW
jgi:hypothetical protein